MDNFKSIHRTDADPKMTTATLNIAPTLVAIALMGGLFITLPSSGANASRPPDPCNKELSVADVQGILTGKAAINHYSMSESNPGEGCSLGVSVSTSTWAMVDISIRQADIQSFRNLLVFVASSRKPVAGIGDEAYATSTMASNIPNAKETDLFARKGNLQCIVQLHRSNGDGEKLVVPTTDNAIATKLGALCEKLFAAR